MYVLRAIAATDLDGLYNLAKKAGTGLTTLPAHKPSLEKKISQSVGSFAGEDTVEAGRYYFLAMEDTETGEIIGCSAIYAGVGLDQPFYCYRMLHVTQASSDPVKRVDTKMLQLSNDFNGASELATLFLSPDHRKPGLGRFLSKGRYLLMAAHPTRFAEKTIAEIRGWVDAEGHSPFWDAVGRHFFQMDFDEADDINGRGNQQFINDLMPKFPIYTALLPEEAQNVIGVPHDGAAPAKRLLETEGFRFSGAVDIFDAGPEMEADTVNIKTIQNSKTGPLAGIIEGGKGDMSHMVAKCDIQDFRIVLSHVVETDSGFWLDEASAKALRCKVGDIICFAPFV